MSTRSLVLREIEHALDRGRILPNSSVLIALSGGVDSQTLAHAFLQVDEERRPRVRAVHVDHRMRPGSEADAERVEAICRAMGLELDRVEVDVDEWKSIYKQGPESAARAARYAAIARVARDRGIRWVATGHTLDDQAETVLLRLIAGSGLEGVSGMEPASRRRVPLDPPGKDATTLSILRPLLAVSRVDIARYAEEHELVPVEDESNEDQEFRRNAIRHSVMPRLEEIAPGAARAMSRTAELLRDDARFLADTVDEAMEQMTALREGVWTIEREGFRDAHPAVQRRVLLRTLEKALSPSARIGQERLEALRVAAVSGRPGAHIEIAEGIACYVDYGRVAIGDGDTLDEDLRRLSWIPILEPGTELPLKGTVDLPLGNGWRLRGHAPDDDGWVLRTRHASDRVRAHRRRAVRLQDWLVDRKVPRYVRDWLPLAAHRDEVRWIIGLDLTEFELPAEGIQLRLERE
jgi:tRNA(Ile)-lysidine synthetase-like protein